MLVLRAVATAFVLGLGAAVPLAGTSLSQTAPPPPSAPEVRVTTDTPEYCNTLAERVARDELARPNAPRQVEELAEEGHHMCATGLIRGGLLRLRRAWLMLRTDK
jgi:hypothetical protein